MIVLGIVFYFIGLIPMAEPFPVVIKVVAIIIALLLVLQFFGVHTGFNLGL